MPDFIHWSQGRREWSSSEGKLNGTPQWKLQSWSLTWVSFTVLMFSSSPPFLGLDWIHNYCLYLEQESAVIQMFWVDLQWLRNHNFMNSFMNAANLCVKQETLKIFAFYCSLPGTLMLAAKYVSTSSLFLVSLVPPFEYIVYQIFRLIILMSVFIELCYPIKFAAVRNAKCKKWAACGELCKKWLTWYSSPAARYKCAFVLDLWSSLHSHHYLETTAVAQ